ncbi:MAG TPA: DUF72 domain-containing protein [Dongiaceae bacterium]|nr:DUF72 domain-containing protein [Dongiaceae bacterium]
MRLLAGPGPRRTDGLPRRLIGGIAQRGSRGRIRIGISGWRYAPWRGRFYPEGLRQKDELAFASAKFGAIEINGTFYSLQRPEDFERWAAATPAGFMFAVKGPRYITHMLKLRNVEAPLANFCANGVLALGPKLGPILWQFPPNFRYDREKLEGFFRLLPRDTETAARLARRHDHRVDGRTRFAIDRNRRLRHAIEIRHDSFRAPDFIALLRKHRVALVCADTVEWPLAMDLTADFVYCRLHGSEELYVSGYDDPALRRWAALVSAWAKGQDPRAAEHISPEPAPARQSRDVFVFFDNDAKVRAPVDAARLMEIIGT